MWRYFPLSITEKLSRVVIFMEIRRFKGQFESTLPPICFCLSAFQSAPLLFVAVVMTQGAEF